MSKGLFLGGVTLLLVVICSSCAIFSREPYQERSRYELTTPNILNVGESKSNVVVNTFDNISSVGRSMLFVNANGELENLPYNEWVQNPEYLLQRLLIARLVGINAVQNIELNGTIWNFSLDIDKKVAHLGVNYQILCYVNRGKKRVFSGTIQTQAPLVKKDGFLAAKAMSSCANELADKLIVLIDSIEIEKE